MNPSSTININHQALSSTIIVSQSLIVTHQTSIVPRPVPPSASTSGTSGGGTCHRPTGARRRAGAAGAVAVRLGVLEQPGAPAPAAPGLDLDFFLGCPTWILVEYLGDYHHHHAFSSSIILVVVTLYCFRFVSNVWLAGWWVGLVVRSCIWYIRAMIWIHFWSTTCTYYKWTFT